MHRDKLIRIGVGVLVLGSLATIVAFERGVFSKTDKASETSSGVKSATVTTVAIETVGGAELADSEAVGSSWPGELISAGDVEVQPQREGSIVEWKVKIGQKVTQGQILARLSAPAISPDLTRTLAEQAQNLARAKAQATATATFAEKNKQQLESLRAQIVSSGKQISDSLSDSSGSDRSKSLATLEASASASNKDVELKTQTVKDYSTQAVRKVFATFTNYSSDPITTYKQSPQNFYFYLRSGLGGQNGATQTDFTRELIDTLKAISNDTESIGQQTLRFLQSADSVVASSYQVEGSSDTLTVLRTTVSTERASLSEKISDLSEAKTESAKIQSELASKRTEFSLTAANTSKETAEKLKEIDEKVAQLEKEIDLANAEVRGTSAAYATIAGAINNGLNITAPRAGIVSIILKKSGDFVSPGTAVASINSGNEKDRLVRFKIPGNVIPPQSGDTLTVIRPGFPKDGKQIKLAGIGISLDGNGSFLADADFVEPVDWPIHASVRVLATNSQSGQSLVSLSAVWWDEAGKSNVWLVTEEGNIRPQEVKTGRTLGDKIEILEGLNQGARIVSKATADLKTGMKLNQISSEQKPAETEEPEGDGHGHAHDE